MASKRLTPVLAAVGLGRCTSYHSRLTLGVVTGIYIFKDPVKQASQDLSTPPSTGSYSSGKTSNDNTSKNSVSESSSGE